MICESCNQEEATVLLTKISADEKRALHLCPACVSQVAQKSNSGDVAPAAAASTVREEKKPVPKPSNAVTGHLPKTDKAVDRVCSRCGMTYKQFRKSGRFGCDDCYQAFGEELRRLMKRIHGAQAHVGKQLQVAEAEADASSQAAAGPASTGVTDDLAELRDQLREAVQSEAYEQAAALRDRIGQLETAAEDSEDAEGEDGQ